MNDQTSDVPFENEGVIVTPIEHGYGEITLPSWEKFISWINRLETNGYVWRGQRRAEWSLQSTFDRLMAERKGMLYPSAFIFDHLTRFKFASRGRRGLNPPTLDTEDEWWALAQHHGLATPLLDWTQSPFAAAFFAFEKEDDQSEYRAIWGLNGVNLMGHVGRVLKHDRAEAVIRDKVLKEGGHKPGDLAYAVLNIKPEAQVRFVRPMSDENQRLVNQSGLFTRAPLGLAVDEWVKKNVPKEVSTGYLLVKLLVPSRDRVEALRMLNRMNINSSTMFPDLSGAAQFCNMATEIDQY